MNIVFLIAAAYTSCSIDVRVPRPLLSQIVWLLVEASKRLLNDR